MSNFKTLHASFVASLKKAFQQNSIEDLKKVFDGAAGFETDKKTALDQSFRDILLFTLFNDIDQSKRFIALSIEVCRKEMASLIIPVVLLGDFFDAAPIDKCELMFQFVEDNVLVWKEELFFAACKNNILRMCNDLLRRLSRSQNTVFCGRILLFLAKFFPFSERSGLNIISEFNLENITEYGADANELGDELGETEGAQLQIDYNLYCKFWALQDYFRNPNQCYDKLKWKTFQLHSTGVLSAFSSFKLEEPRGQSSKAAAEEATTMEVTEDNLKETQHFFAKFLTNPKLLSLQLSDSNFRRSVLVQFLILFQYLNSTVKFKAENFALTTAQTDWLKETETQVYKLLDETPPNGKKFAKSVQHMLSREELWNNWKNDGCKDFKRPEVPVTDDEEDGGTSKPPTKKPKKLLGDLIRDYNKQGKFYMGNPELTRLWNLCPDNLQACKGVDRNFLPSLESYLENPKEKADPSFEWRALRLLARQSPHFFTLVNSPSCKIADYLESVRKKIQKDKVDVKQEQLDVDATDEQVETENFEESEQLDSDLLKSETQIQEDQNVHRSVTVTPEQMKEIAVAVGADWKKLGVKLGYSADEILFFETENPTVIEQCRAMLKIWFDDDMDASLDNLAYILEGLEMITATETAKKFIPADSGEGKIEEISD